METLAHPGASLGEVDTMVFASGGVVAYNKMTGDNLLEEARKMVKAGQQTKAQHVGAG